MRIVRLEWDDTNIEHIISRHGLSVEEVEDVCFGAHYVCSVKYNRKAVYGRTSSGKYTMVVLEKLYDGVFRPITARGMDRRERGKYREIMREG